MVLKMTDRNLKQELLYVYYDDVENGIINENIDQECLIDLLKEILTRLEKLEEQK